MRRKSKEEFQSSSSGDYNKLWDELKEAFPSYNHLKMLVRRYLNENLNEISEPKPICSVVNDLIDHTISHDTLPELISAAYKERPNNETFKELYHKYCESEQVETSPKRDKPFKIPIETEPFISRENELKKLEEIIIDPNNNRGQKVCISGMGGVGKTYLACHFAWQYRDEFPDGVIYVNVIGKELKDIALEIAAYYEEKNDNHDNYQVIMQELFESKTALLIFDYVEEEKIDILKLFPRHSPSSIILTSRDKTLGKTAIFSKNRLHLDPFDDKDTEEFLNLHLEEELKKQEKKQGGSKKKYISEIFELTGGLPLALKIICSLIIAPEIGKGSIRNRLKQVNTIRRKNKKNLQTERQLILGKFLDEEFSDYTDINQTVETLIACFELSLTYLERRKRGKAIVKFLKSLGVFQKKEIWFLATKFLLFPTKKFLIDEERSQEQDDELESYFELFKRFSLLENDQTTEYYIFHPLVHTFLQYQLDQDPALKQEVSNIRDQFYLKFDQYRYLSNLDKDELTDKELPEIEYAILNKVNFLINHEILPSQDFYEFGRWLYFFIEDNRVDEQGIAIMSAYQRLAEYNSDWEKIILFTQWHSLFLDRNPRQAMDNLIKLEEQNIFQNVYPLKARKRHCSQFLTTKAVIQGRLRENSDPSLLQNSIEIKREIKDKKGEAMSLNTSAKNYERQGKYQEAITYYQQAINIKRGLNLSESLARSLTDLGALYRKPSQYRDLIKSLDYLLEAKKIKQQFRNKKNLVITIGELAETYQALGNFEQAIQELKEGENLQTNKDNPTGRDRNIRVPLYRSWGNVCKKQGKLDDAIHYYQLVIDSEPENNREGKGKMYTSIGIIYNQKRDFRNAKECLIFAFDMDMADDRKNEKGVALVLPPLVEALQALGEHSEAIRYCERALTLFPRNKEFQDLKNKLSRHRRR